MALTMNLKLASPIQPQLIQQPVLDRCKWYCQQLVTAGINALANYSAEPIGNTIVITRDDGRSFNLMTRGGLQTQPCMLSRMCQ